MDRARKNDIKEKQCAQISNNDMMQMRNRSKGQRKEKKKMWKNQINI